jgi:hypothetical protein
MNDCKASVYVIQRQRVKPLSALTNPRVALSSFALSGSGKATPELIPSILGRRRSHNAYTK